MEINDVYYIFLNYIFSSLPWIKKKHTHTKIASLATGWLPAPPQCGLYIHSCWKEPGLLEGRLSLGLDLEMYKMSLEFLIIIRKAKHCPRLLGR